MALDSASKLGSILGSLTTSQDQIEQNIAPDESDALFNSSQNEQLLVLGTVRSIKRPYNNGAFIIGHPIQGDLNNTLYKLDLGYATNIDSFFSLPVSMPVTFAGGTTATSVIFTAEF